MAYQISDECISCGVCKDNCPAEAISEGDGQYVIDPDKCIDCGACESNCPVGAPKRVAHNAVYLRVSRQSDFYFIYGLLTFV